MLTLDRGLQSLAMSHFTIFPIETSSTKVPSQAMHEDAYWAHDLTEQLHGLDQPLILLLSDTTTDFADTNPLTCLHNLKNTPIRHVKSPSIEEPQVSQTEQPPTSSVSHPDRISTSPEPRSVKAPTERDNPSTLADPNTIALLQDSVMTASVQSAYADSSPLELS